MLPPCQGCTERTVLPNCHMGCDRYKRFCLERERIRTGRQQANDLAGARRDGVLRNLKRRNERRWGK